MSSFAPIGSQERLSGDSFWPSFTDIMMVIVMIFLFATSILIVRNFHLVDELQKSLAAEKRAEAVIETTSLENANLEMRLNSVESQIENATQENATLEERLTNYEQENSLLRLQILAKNEKLKRAERKKVQQQLKLEELNKKNALMLASIKNQDRQLKDNSLSISSLNNENAQFKVDLARLKNEFLNQKSRFETELIAQTSLSKQLKDQNSALKDQVSTLQISYDSTTEQLKQLDKENTENNLTINSLKEERKQYNEELFTLKGDYEIVKAKYQKLIKPARSAKGKYIAEVHYVKSDKKNLIRYKEPSDADYSELSLKQVENKLGKLKAKYGKELYVKIIIPKNSGLTYNEAWSFMKGLLDKYDYYYQKQLKK